MSVLFMGPPPTAEVPGLVITDEPCTLCGWPETIVRLFISGRVEQGCAGCDADLGEHTERPAT